MIKRWLGVLMASVMVCSSVPTGNFALRTAYAAQVGENSGSYTVEQVRKMTAEGKYVKNTDGSFSCVNTSGTFKVDCDGLLVAAEITNGTKVLVLPDGILKIKEGLFRDGIYRSFHTVVFPQTMEYTGKWVFADCTMLEQVYFNDGLREISVNAFSGCESLQKVVMPQSMKFIGKSAFEGCVGLQEVVLNDGIEEIRESAFMDCDSLKQLYFPDSIQRLDDMILASCDNLERILVYDVKNYSDYTLAGMSYQGKKKRIVVYGEKGSFAEEQCRTPGWIPYTFREITPEIVAEMRGSVPVYTSAPTAVVTVVPAKTPTVTVTPVCTEVAVETKNPVVTASPVPSTTPEVTVTPSSKPANTVAPTKTPMVSVTKMPVVTSLPIVNEKEVVVYYGHAGWNNAYIHYKVGNGNWTKVPGVCMNKENGVAGYQWKYSIAIEKGQEVMVCFNNGEGHWDSQNGKNYMLRAGGFGVKDGKVELIQKPEVNLEPQGTPVVTKKPVVTNRPVQTPVSQTLTVYYNNTWEMANVHYKTENGAWTVVPGKKMVPTGEMEGYRWKYEIKAEKGTRISVCFNDGKGHWDSQNGANYQMTTGSYGVKNGKVYQVVLKPAKTKEPEVTSVPNKTKEPVSTKKPAETEMPVVTASPETTNIPKEDVVYVYYNTTWEKAYIHYQVGNGVWTKAPGVAMDKSSKYPGYTYVYAIPLAGEENVTVCFNNGLGIWDSRNGKNYLISGAGSYGVKNGNVQSLSGVTVTNVPVATAEPIVVPAVTERPEGIVVPKEENVVIFYENTGWNNVYVHYRIGNGVWSVLPGVAMKRSGEQTGYSWKIGISVETGENVEVCFNNGNGNWDSRNGQNYNISGSGIYGIKQGQIKRLK